MDIPVKLGTTLNNIQLLKNQANAKLVNGFYLYLKSVNTSESYQNQNIQALPISKESLLYYTKFVDKEKIIYSFIIVMTE